MHDTTGLVRPAKDYTPADNPRFLELHRRFPTIAYLREHARRHVPSFAFEYMDGGAGADGGIARNWNAFDAIGRAFDRLRPQDGRARVTAEFDALLAPRGRAQAPDALDGYWRGATRRR